MSTTHLTRPGTPTPAAPRRARPIVIAHRGASGYAPEHTLASYALAMLHGADFIEPDLVMTKDGCLIARHDNVLDLTTDVAQHAEFADRRTVKVIDGNRVEGWFSEDFTLDEIKRLRAIERIPQIRPANARLDGQFAVPTLQEIVDFAAAFERALKRPIGIYPETKHPTHFARLGLAMEEPLVEILHRNGYGATPERVFIQSFEIGNLKKLKRLTRLPLIQLLESRGQPADVAAAGGATTYDDMATAAGLAEIATYAAGVGPEKQRIFPLDANGALDPARASDFVANAHAAGLEVHPYTFRAENIFLPANLRSSEAPNAFGRSDDEIRFFLAAGVDGFFNDQPNIGVRVRDAFATGR
jgi:glycerophosphoryl diester phosphodiesterase